MPEFTSKLLNFKIKDATSYDTVTAEFGHLVDRLSPVLAKRVVCLAGVAAGQRVLDIGTGTGVVALEAAKIGGKVVGIDLSPKLLSAAEAQARVAGLASQIKFKTMDAEALQFQNASFDVVVSLFALLHFPNPAVALTEMFRVLKPNGTLVVAVGSAPPWVSLRGLAHGLRIVPEVVARLLGRQLVAPGVLNRLVEAYIPANNDAEESPLAQEGRNRSRNVPQLVRDAGFKDVRQHWEGHQAQLETTDDFWDIQRTFSSIARKRLNGVAPERVAAVRAKFDECCRQVLSRGGRLVYPFAAFFVTARRP